MDTPEFMPFINILAYIAVVIAFILAGERVFGHRTMLEVYHEHPTSFTPAEFAFGIWFLIFILLGIFVVYQALPAYRGNVFVKRISWLFLLHCIGLFAWPLFWNFRVLWPAVIAFLWVLVTGIMIYLRIGVDYSKRGQYRTVESPAGTIAREGGVITTADFWVIQTPFSLMLGWLFPLTILNLWIASTYGADSSPEAWTYPGWSAAMCTFLTVAAIGMLIVRSDFLFSAVITWYLFGVAAEHRHDDVVQTSSLVNACLVLIATIIAASMTAFRYSQRERLGYEEIQAPLRA